MSVRETAFAVEVLGKGPITNVRETAFAVEVLGKGPITNVRETAFAVEALGISSSVSNIRVTHMGVAILVSTRLKNSMINNPHYIL